MSLPGNGSTLATHAARKELFTTAGRLVVDLARRYYDEGSDDVLPRAIASRAAFENGIALTMALGGSTNAVLHLLAIAHSAGVPLTLDDFEAIRARAR